MKHVERWLTFVLLWTPLMAAADLTGVWQGNDGGIYYLRQMGEDLHWYGEQNAVEPRWANVFSGRVRGEHIGGDWLDVPKGKTLGQGKLNLTIRDDGKVLERTRESGGFGGSRWTRVNPAPLAITTPRAQPQMAMRPPEMALQEDCIGLNPAKVSLSQINNSWKIVEGSHWLFDFGSKRDEARQAERVLRHYRMDKSCFVGRPQPSLTYLLAGDRAPRGPMPGEDCIGFNLDNVAVIEANGRWKLADGSHWLFDFGSNKVEAGQALAVLRKHGFSHACYVGRPQPSFSYLRR